MKSSIKLASPSRHPRTAIGPRQPRLGSRGQPEQTKAAILDAAMEEFAHEGLAGARTDAIARAAGVNKALLYYYFGDKESLYGAVLDRVFSGLAERVGAALNSSLPPREKVLAYAGAHFDYVASSPFNPRLVYRELMRAGRSGSPHLDRIVERYLGPTFRKVNATLMEGIEAGVFRDVDPVQFTLTMVASIVFYFTSTPVIAAVTHLDPLSPERIAARRAAVLDFISAALFTPGPATPTSRRSLLKPGKSKRGRT
jgi:TetR/AcrR family transcriptional regulator